MKGCLVMQRRFAYLVHELAILLKERHGVDAFCGYVFTRDSFKFISEQSDIRYTNLILDEDIHRLYKDEVLDYEYLMKLERELGTLWSIINVDRIVRFGQLIREYPYADSPYTHEDILRIVQVYAKRITEFLDAEKPNFVFMAQPGAVGSMLLLMMAKKRGIKVLMPVVPLTSDFVAVSERFDRLTGVEELWNANRAKSLKEVPRYAEAKRFLKEFRDKPVMYSKAYPLLIKHGKWKQFDFLLPKNIARTIQYNAYQIFAEWIHDRKKREDYTTVHPLWHTYDGMKRKIRNLIGVDDLYDTYDPTRPFVFYPLQFEPELTILLLAPFDLDQLAIIKRLAQSLPVGMLVYVKEHPQMSAYRPRRFYREIKKIPNVKLIRPEISSFDLIQQAALVAVISGAAGWEATLFGKPVLTFGKIFYNALSFVAHSRIPEELPTLIDAQLNRFHFDEEELTRFVAALFEDCARCDLLYLWEFEADRKKKREDLIDLASLIARKIQSVTKRP